MPQNKQKTSFIWNFFSEKPGSDNLATCDICKQVFSYKSSSNNLRKHMTRKHPLVNINTDKNLKKDRPQRFRFRSPQNVQAQPSTSHESIDKPVAVSDDAHVQANKSQQIS
ncbi:unnamed protein product [Brassicogethes aeneus]|uniref:BED-type domain-containing protein n=1 Tax=Brassicogethes aeneus TaxID=1431903 RepID=A0A9P0BIZ8_BRAAE|nr:unnamed protein product [Brassicogethes aeneus]